MKKAGHDVRERGLRDAPPVRVVVSKEAHATVFSALSLLGIGKRDMILAGTTGSGAMDAACVPKPGPGCLLLLQAGNVVGGAFDDFETLVGMAREAGAWVHVDGAFGLWAAASEKCRHLVRGMEGRIPGASMPTRP